MTWNFRACKTIRTVGEERHEEYTIREVYYDEEGKVRGWGANPAYPFGDVFTELYDDVSRMVMCLSKPVLDLTDEDNPHEVPQHLEG